ncbi:FAD-dependent monooxygenase [Actinomycetospora sp. NBRC 106378]|uniref:FAD-dependent monooxygenase n=1 Tax=Actinomycetospora sp. NBRC 106378 TaxID=3032208 RepID=UPI0024A3B987|nr:FAD-dependent monooxygenase [Actinomycetospora sp. NBRC 106378]GLZ56387.1 FAD-dependent oxidoreductase [Actinomycetospora sp. NBRC 106378]
MTRVLISGAGIAGPALGLWLARYGFEVTIVEQAPAVRPGGQAVDFKGETHLTVLRRMGLLDDVERLATGGGDDGRIVDAEGRTIGITPAAFSGGDIEIRRGDLAHLLVERTATTCRYVFDDSITALHETPDGVDVAFRRSPSQRFDLVVGADGIHSTVRRLAFGPESDYVTHLGHYYALLEVGGRLVEGDEMYNEPGRMASTGGPKAPAFFVFASPPLGVERGDVEAQKQALRDAFVGASWKVPQLLDALPDAQGFHLDSISRVRVDRYSRGRVVLVGDAAYGNALGGFGTGLALVGAYVLAGELMTAGGDASRAFAAYDAKFRGYAKVADKVNAGALLAPPTRTRIWLRNKLFSVAPLFLGVMALMDRFATDIELEDYPSAAPSSTV